MLNIPSSVINLEKLDDLDKLMELNEYLILDFSTDWCPPCRVMEGTIVNLAFELEGKAKIIKIDPEVFPEVLKKYSIKGIPYFLGIQNAKIIGKAHGIVPIDQLKKLINL
ncbi:thioredoxin [Flammeovirga pectinis]|uniref:Thioredoxin n=1 Tax=Flammeovirga pectinis TaxID=2494373 RepID=A0A3S9P4C6_9BACT|nr:thioredoxin family protein [Flammeovirga pectinis]AZQ63077.1 thioredoxin [Flammeovirga pectinis]